MPWDACPDLVQQAVRDQVQLVTRAGLVVNDEVVEAVGALSARDGRWDVPELSDGHLQGSLAWLAGGAEG
jgi:hypothetical protein